MRFLFGFVVYFGRHQFGAYDYNVAIELGWKQMLGQRPYTDFPASTPPLFNLGMLWAFRLFGVSWDAQLVMTGLFTCATFLWLYGLLRRMGLHEGGALLTAFAVESTAVLPLCFWWYNDITFMLAAVTFVSALLWAAEMERGGPTWFGQGSVVLALALVSLTKPNVAGVTVVATVLLLLVVSGRSLRGLLLVLAAAALGVGLLVANGVPVPALMRSYLGVAHTRGFGTVGFWHMNKLEQLLTMLWFPALSWPLLRLFRRGEGVRGIPQPPTVRAYFLLGPLLAVYGVATNVEFREVEQTVLLAAGCIIIFGMRLGGERLRSMYVGLLWAGIATQIYLGATRLRVDAVGYHRFFEWADSEHRLETGFLKHMRVSGPMVEIEREIKTAVRQSPGPVFFGPRLDFNYAVLRLPSPTGFPAWWEPGTAFAREDTGRLLSVWESHHFQTLVFLRNDPPIYYTPEFLAMIEREYVEMPDVQWPWLKVYRRR